MSRSLPFSLPVLAVAVGVLMPATALARPSFDFSAPCYAEGDTIRYSGSGYTPNGEVNLLFSANGRIGGVYGTRANEEGGLYGGLRAPDPDRLMDSRDAATDVFVSANDRTRLEASGPPEEAAGFNTLRLSRFGFRLSTKGGRPVSPRKALRFEVRGYTGAVGKPAFLHYRRGGLTVMTVRLGTLRGPCGDLNRTLPRAFAFRPVRAGEFRLVINTSPTNPARAPSSSMRVKIARRDAVRRSTRR